VQPLYAIMERRVSFADFRWCALMTDQLTDRETEILRLMVEGFSNHEIARQLALSVETVRWYNKQLYSKLHVHSRKEAIQKARTHGLTALPHPQAAPPHNLPAELTPFVGREKELRDVGVLLDGPDAHLITILGPGGIGKTRLALEVARRSVGPRFSDGVFFAALSPLSDPVHLIPAIAGAVRYQFQQDSRSPRQQVLDYFRQKRLLLVLDNFEHLLDGADIITDLLQAAPDVRLLATSREKLNLRGETVYTPGGLAYAGDGFPQDAVEYEAAQLFIQSASQIHPDFTVQADEQAYLTDICQLTDGLPLALVLAAAWVDVLSLREIADELRQSIAFLRAEMRDAPRRHWSIRAVFEPTWERLTQREQATFMKLAVFRGGFTRDAADKVAGADLPTLQALINKSLLQRNAHGRYDIHELLRQYGEEHLNASQQEAAARTAHMTYYSDC
jgi:predicted ATPase/DNA-binding CsgD family transcriptional regulator